VDRRKPDEFQRRIGERLRRVREKQRLTLAAVEVLSHGRFNPVPSPPTSAGTGLSRSKTAAELAWRYGVPLGDLLPPAK
jgi:hypothetical protein